MLHDYEPNVNLRTHKKSHIHLGAYLSFNHVFARLMMAHKKAETGTIFKIIKCCYAWGQYTNTEITPVCSTNCDIIFVICLITRQCCLPPPPTHPESSAAAHTGNNSMLCIENIFAGQILNTGLSHQHLPNLNCAIFTCWIC